MFHVFFWNMLLNERLPRKPECDFGIKLPVNTVQADPQFVQHIICDLRYLIICDAVPGYHL